MGRHDTHVMWEELVLSCSHRMLYVGFRAGTSTALSYSMPANLVPEGKYQQLIDSLKQATPKSLSVSKHSLFILS